MFAPLCACPGEPTQECVDSEILRLCSGEQCEERACRGDALCQDDACQHWAETELWADLDLRPFPGQTDLIEFEVLGGFPWERVRHIRVDFGDGDVGWGEGGFHRYDAPGVYPVRLEVELEGYRLLRANRLAVIEPLPSDWNPLLLTVNDTPALLNGSQPYQSDNFTPGDPSDDYAQDFHLLLPRHGFDVDVWLLTAPGAELSPENLELTADVALADGSPAGTNLAERLVFDSEPHAGVLHGRWRVQEGEAFAAGMASLDLAGTSGTAARHERHLGIELVDLTPERDPFSRPMSWLLRFNMDRYSASASHHDGGVIALESLPGPNGQADFAEELRLIGCQGAESAAGAASVEGRGARGANAIYLRWVQQEIAAGIYRHFHMGPDGEPRDGIRMKIYVDSDPDAPDPALFSPDGAFSMMRFGGALADNFGRSWLSEFNQERIDDTADNMGVGTARLLGLLSAAPVLTDQLNPVKPNTGTPVGEDSRDAEVLAAGFDRYDPGTPSELQERYDDLAWIAQIIGLTIASVGAHEMGHALGLVPQGAPPDGFFGGRGDISFINAELTDGHHADYPQLNLMQSGGNPFVIISEALETVEMPRYYDTVEIFYALGHEMRLAAYSRAYLQRRQSYISIN